MTSSNFPNKTNTASPEEEFNELNGFYLDMMTHVERLHRLLQDLVKARLDQFNIVEINSVQALLLHNIGSVELTAGELKTRGFYQGSNVSYNLKKLVDMGYVNYERSHMDKRSVRIKLTDKGVNIASLIEEMFKKQTENLISRRIIDIAGLEDLCLICKDFERFWDDYIRYGE